MLAAGAYPPGRSPLLLCAVPAVLHILPHRGGGAEVYIDLLAGAPDFRHERVALSSRRTLPGALPSIVARWPGIARRSSSADLLHVHGDVAAALSVPLLRRPGVITTHGLHLLRRLEGPVRPAFVVALRAAVARSRVTICTSELERRELEEVLAPELHERLEVIVNGVRAAADVNAAERAVVRASLALDEQDVLFLFVGELEERKGPLTAARAARSVRAQGRPIVLALAGEGPLGGELADLEGEPVRVLGYRRDVPSLLSAADAFVLPSSREGLSMALLEAMAHGVPAIVCDGSGNPQAVGEAGIVAPFGDERALAEAFARLIDDPALRARLGALARGRVRDEFGVETFLRRTELVYERALAAGARAR
jgi:glycosyltransferase involved in cell wall biosynthesis